MEQLRNVVMKISKFLESNLKLYLNKDKIIIRKYNQGIDFLGYVSFNYFRILRVKTKNRTLRRIKENKSRENFNQSLQSYLGILKHCNSYKIKKKIDKILLN